MTAECLTCVQMLMKTLQFICLLKLMCLGALTWRMRPFWITSIHIIIIRQHTHRWSSSSLQSVCKQDEDKKADSPDGHAPWWWTHRSWGSPPAAAAPTGRWRWASGRCRTGSAQSAPAGWLRKALWSNPTQEQGKTGKKYDILELMTAMRVLVTASSAETLMPVRTTKWGQVITPQLQDDSSTATTRAKMLTTFFSSLIALLLTRHLFWIRADTKHKWLPSACVTMLHRGYTGPKRVKILKWDYDTA